MRFPGHETVSIGNRVRVNDALLAAVPENEPALPSLSQIYLTIIHRSGGKYPPLSPTLRQLKHSPSKQGKL